MKSRGSFQKTRGRKSHSSNNDSYGVGVDSSSSTESSTKEYSSSRNPVSQNNVSARQLRELGWSEARIKAYALLMMLTLVVSVDVNRIPINTIIVLTIRVNVKKQELGHHKTVVFF